MLLKHQDSMLNMYKVYKRVFITTEELSWSISSGQCGRGLMNSEKHHKQHQKVFVHVLNVLLVYLDCFTKACVRFKLVKNS